MDAAGNVYIADVDNNRIRKLAVSTGIITTFAGNGGFGFSGDGGAGSSAALYYPSGVAVDAAGNVYSTDTYNQRIRVVVASTGIITTIAGNGTAGFSGDGGAGTSAALSYPTHVAVDVAGNVYLADAGNQRVRRINGRLFTTPIHTPTPSPSASPTPFCWPSLYRALPRMDLVGTLAGSALFPNTVFLAATENDCRQSCCDAPACDSYTFAAPALQFSATGSASCFLYVNITALVPSSTVTSGVLFSVYT